MPSSVKELSPSSRLSSIDWLRGFVMVLMLIDHIREFLHAESFWHGTSNLAVVSSATFLTRWVTHICAPVFVLLAGVSVRLQVEGGKPIEAVQRFLWTRGLWLLVCEFTLVTLGADFRLNPWAQTMVAQVIWVIGLSMILMALLVRLPMKLILGFGLVLVCGHNLLDPIRMAPHGWGGVWAALHQGGMVALWQGGFPRITFAYPLLPWPGVMALGYGLGACYALPSAGRRRILGRLGLLCLVVFAALRAWNHYGEPLHWSAQATPFRTVLSFLSVTKYPASLLYLLVTLGLGLLLLAWREGRTDNALDRALVTFGRVPMFFYLLQWPVAHGMGVLFHALAGKSWRFVVFLSGPVPSDHGFRLWAVYLGWALGLVLLYPLCRWYAGFKRRHAEWILLSYL